MDGFFALIVLLSGAYAAGYFTRDHLSRKRRREVDRSWKNYVDLDPPEHANTNNPALSLAATDRPAAETHGDLGQMLDRWESRARTRRMQ